MSSCVSSRGSPGLPALLDKLEEISRVVDHAAEHERAQACECEAYRDHRDVRYSDRPRPTVNASNADELLDKIPEGLVARVAVSSLVGVAPTCCRHGLEILLGTRSPPRVAPEIEQRNRQRRGVPRDTIGGGVAEAVRHLAGPKILLYEPCTQACKYTCSCGSFFVEKKAGSDGTVKLRTILDARRANAWMDNSTQLREVEFEGDDADEDADDTTASATSDRAKSTGVDVDYYFPLISLEELYRLIASMPGRSSKRSQQYYVINAGFRHYYHQLPLHDSLKPYFTMMLENSSRSREWFVPRALPMGWILAPYIAQCCTWAMLLGGHETLKRTTHGFASEDVAALKTLPAWLPLECGGGIVVLMDNILVITPNISHARAWASRMQGFACDPTTDGRGFNVLYKGDVRVQVIRKQAVDGSQTAGSGAASTGQPSEAAEHFEFLGVKRWYDGRQLAVDTSEPWPKGLDEATCRWSGTHRELASVVGKLLWYHRVARHNMFATTMQGFKQLMSSVTPPNGKWNSLARNLPRACIEAMISGWRERRLQLPFHNEPVLELTERRFAFAAVDASGDAYGAVYWDTSLDSEPSEWSSPQKPSFNYIALSELASIIIAVHELRARNPRANTLVIATDNQTAKTWIENRGAKSTLANRLLELLFIEVLGDNTDLRLTYVRSKANAADPASRRSTVFADDEKHRVTLTIELLRARAQLAELVAEQGRRQRCDNAETKVVSSLVAQ